MAYSKLSVTIPQNDITFGKSCPPSPSLLVELRKKYDGKLCCSSCGFNYVTNGPVEDPRTYEWKEPCVSCHPVFIEQMRVWIKNAREWEEQESDERLQARIRAERRRR